MMSPHSLDGFLGEWAVKEYIYSPQSELLGIIHQQRRLNRGDSADELRVDLFCEPSLELADHPMGAFAGEFSFRLIKQGIQRLYLGPDVQGFAYSLGEIFLCGEGIWPRFGYNFRSWSIRLSETYQLIGGVFFRGFNVIGVIFGVATLANSQQHGSALCLASEMRGGQGHAETLQLGTKTVSTEPWARQHRGAGLWVESRNGREESLSLTACKSGFVMNRIKHDDDRREEVGMAVAYGPCLFWETHGKFANSTQGIEINDPLGTQMFSIRRNFLSGQMQSLEVLQLSE